MSTCSLSVLAADPRRVYRAVMIPDNWTPETLTARQVVAHPNIHLSLACQGCRASIGLNPWAIGARLADEPLQTLRFRCRRCGVYPSMLEVARQTSMAPERLMQIPLRPRCWDDGHAEDQRRQLARAEASRQARAEAALKAMGRPPSDRR